MKRFARCISLLVVLALVLAMPVYAVDDRAIEASNFFSYTRAYLAKQSGTTFHICFQVTGTGIMDKIGASYIELQCSSDDSNWDPVATYSKVNYDSMTDDNTQTHASYFTYTGVKGYYYRAYVEFYAEDDTGTGCYTYYTSSIKVP